MEVILYLPVFILGAVWGSFINMAVYRVKHELGFGGRSFCDHTKDTLTAKDLVPVFSYLIYKGRCRHCHKKLSPIYPIVEIITAVLFVISAYYLTLQGYSTELLLVNFLILIIFVIFFVFFAAYDYLYWQVNVKAIKLALFFAFTVSIAGVFIDGLVITGLYPLFAGLLAGGIIWLVVKLTHGSGMGEGDIYLMAFAGIFVSLGGLLPLLLISSVSGSIVGLIKAAKIGKIKDVKIQFVPFIVFGSLVAFFLQDLLLNWLHLDYYFS